MPQETYVWDGAFWQPIHGLDGATGPQGPASTVPGPAGTDGKTVRSGIGPPSAGLGVDGDWYIATDTKTIYGPKTAGIWGVGTSLVGIQGVQGVPGPAAGTRLVKAADQANTTVTFADVVGLTASLAANETVTFQFFLYYTTAATTTALQVSVNGPALPAAVRFAVETQTTAAVPHYAVQAAYDANTNPATGGAATVLGVQIHGRVVNGANAGTLAVRMRSEVAASAVTVLAGSWGFVYR